MEYFLMKPFEGGCRLQIIRKDPDILIGKVAKKGDLPDFTLHPCPLISNRFKELLEQYLPSMNFIPCVLEGESQPDFWTFKLQEPDQRHARFRPDGSVCAVEPVGLLPVFMVPNYKKDSYVINLALAESLMRRGFVNLELERIDTLGEDSYAKI